MTQQFNIPGVPAPIDTVAAAAVTTAQAPSALAGVDASYTEEIQKCVANGKLSISIEAVYNLTKDKIATSRAQQVHPIDVITVIKTAVSAGLDPTSDDVFAFKSSDRVIVGISKKGWSKVLDSRKASINFNYGPILPAAVGQKSHYEWVSAVITKHDGCKIEGPRVYNDEFDRRKDVWLSNPKAMLVARAFTHACAMAFGIGAYDEEEARGIFNENNSSRRAAPVKMQTAAEPLPAVPQLPVQAANPFEDCKSVQELVNSFNELPEQQRNNAAIKNFYKQAKLQLLASMPSEEDWQEENQL